MIVALAVALVVAAGPLRLDEARAPHHHRPDLPRATPTAPQRIVSLAPVATETLFALGAGDRVVGVTRYCDRPAAAQALPKIGGYVDPDLEKILSLRPDLVVAMPSFGHRVVLDALREKGVPVLVVFGDTTREVKDLVVAIGADVGRIDEAQRVVDALDARLARVRRGATEPIAALRAVVAVGVSPLVVAGPGSFADEALALVGATPAVARGAPAWPVWSLEALVQAKADVVVAAEGPAAAAALEALLDGALPRGHPRRPRVVAAPGPILMRPGPALADDVEALAGLLAAASPEPASRRASSPPFPSPPSPSPPSTSPSPVLSPPSPRDAGSTAGAR